jgi:hypothetical protein
MIKENEETDVIQYRKLITYDQERLQIMNVRKYIIITEIELLELEKISELYDNQKRMADKIVEAFDNRTTICVMMVAKTQSGKTGSMCAAIKNI